MSINKSFAKHELQTIATCFDNKTMTLKVAKARVWGYYGIDIKARSKEDFIKKFSKAIKES